MGEPTIYTHDRAAFTVGQLRQALAGLPDHLPVAVSAPSAPGQPADHELVIVGVGHGWVTEGDESYIDATLGIQCDYASGEWAIS